MNCWLIEKSLAGRAHYLSTAVSETSIGYTDDPHRAWQFPSQAAAHLVMNAIGVLCFGAKPVEHAFIENAPEPEFPFDRHQEICRENGTRYYGDGGTIHGTQHLHVETNIEGDVVAVWFRCQPLPFEQVVVGLSRAREMRSMGNPRSRGTSLHGVEVRDPK
jgi:hypothetical protein